MDMKDLPLTLRSVRRLTDDIYELRLSGDLSGIERPGQFVNLALPGCYLRRPISVADWTPEELLLLVRAVGVGTRELVSAAPGTVFPTLLPLGKGFDIAAGQGTRSVLVGGGIGIAPLYGLARTMRAAGQSPDIALGFRNAADAFYLDEFRALGLEAHVATEDGSLGRKGFVTDVLREDCPGAGFVFACGPMPMLRAVHALPQVTGGEYSFEARMGCGFGACVGCTIRTAGGPKRVCKEGPVFRQEEIQW